MEFARGPDRTSGIRRVLFGVLVANWTVAVAKLIYGLLNDSAAVTADGTHSLIDGGSNVLGLVAMSIAAQPADDDHPYGHGKFEALAALGIGAMVGIGMLELGRMALDSLLHGHHPAATLEMFVVVGTTLVINVATTRIERHYGAKLKSPLLLADSHHSLSDVYVTASVLVSLLLVRLGYPRADGIAALVIMGFVARVGYVIVKHAIGILSDSARLDPTKVAEVTSGIDGVRGCKDVRSRGMEESVYVDLKIEVDPGLPTSRAHALADEVERKLAEAFPQVVDVVVHVEPSVAVRSVATARE